MKICVFHTLQPQPSKVNYLYTAAEPGKRNWYDAVYIGLSIGEIEKYADKHFAAYISIFHTTLDIFWNFEYNVTCREKLMLHRDI